MRGQNPSKHEASQMARTSRTWTARNPGPIPKMEMRRAIRSIAFAGLWVFKTLGPGGSNKALQALSPRHFPRFRVCVCGGSCACYEGFTQLLVKPAAFAEFVVVVERGEAESAVVLWSAFSAAASPIFTRNPSHY